MNAIALPRISRRWHWLAQFLQVLFLLSVVTAVGWHWLLSYRAIGQIYLLAVTVLSLRVGRWAALFAAVLSGIVWNFIFIPPRMSFSVLHLEDILLLAIYFIVALGGGHVALLQAAARREKVLAESERLHQVLFDSIAHELKTPLAVLRTAAEGIGSPDENQRRQMTRVIRVTVQRLENLVANLLNHTRLESGVIRPQLEPCDVRELIHSARRLLGDRLTGRRVTVSLPPSVPLVLADAPLLEQALANLLLNAVVHTAETAEVAVEAGEDAVQGRVFIRVRDNGPGIPEEIRPAIFDKFQRGTRGSRRGLGLGLSIVRGFLQVQHGEVALECPPAGGSIFTVFLPIATLSPFPPDEP